MRLLSVSAAFLISTSVTVTSAQDSSAPVRTDPQPLYKVTIVSRTTKALNYGYLSTPTKIGFDGTAVLPEADGDATIEPKKGATLVKARFSNLPPPTRFGPQYLTYVLWAITPEGRAENLGELVTNRSNKAALNTSTTFQTFALVVTAEPYFSVSQPSEVVVMENVVIPGTIGKVQEVNATYEFLPRKEYTYDTQAAQAAPGRAVSQDEYEAIVAMYQALNAIQIAESQGAQRHAGDRMARARELYERARQHPRHLSRETVSLAREATQIAEDARAIAIKRAQSERELQERQTREAQEREAANRAAANRAAAERAEAERAEAERAAAESADRARRIDEQARAAEAVPPAPQQPTQLVEPANPPIEVDDRQFHRRDPAQQENRVHILSALRGQFETMDTPRGIVVTVPESLANSSSLSSSMNVLAAAIRPYRELHLEVETHTDRPDVSGSTQRQAETVRRALTAAGISPNIIVARGMSNSRPRTSNATPSGRMENRRTEIIIAGDSIGSTATWDRTYRLRPSGDRP